METILTGKQMKKIENYTINEIGIPSIVLMERAALKVTEIIMGQISEQNIHAPKILVVCGHGNNGGDGYAIARLLSQARYQVSICFVGDEEKRSEENRIQKKIASHFIYEEFYDFDILCEKNDYDIIVDAVFGIGLSRRLSEQYISIIEHLNGMNGLKIAVDTPSGVCDSNGIIYETAFKADVTVALGYKKRGLVLPPGNEYAGKTIVVPIGITFPSFDSDEKWIDSYTSLKDFAYYFPKRSMNANKGTCGKVGLFVGSKGMSGAAYLCAKAAYASGAGLVNICTHEDNRVILQQLLPEAILTTYDQYSEDIINKVLKWSDLIGIGCGLGQSSDSESLVKYVLKETDKPCIIDADALNIIAKDMDILQERKGISVLTPHMKEMTRLLECEMKELEENRVDLLTDFVNKYEITCVLKDSRTLIASYGNNRIYINLSGNSAMAKGGSGDVLAGMISGILAQKMHVLKDIYEEHSVKKNVFELVAASVYIHGLAGDEARDRKGNYSVLASDIIDSIGAILKTDYFA